MIVNEKILHQRPSDIEITDMNTMLNVYKPDAHFLNNFSWILLDYGSYRILQANSAQLVVKHECWKVIWLWFNILYLRQNILNNIWLISTLLCQLSNSLK